MFIDYLIISSSHKGPTDFCPTTLCSRL